MKAKQVGAAVVVGWRRDGKVARTSMIVADVVIRIKIFNRIFSLLGPNGRSNSDFSNTSLKLQDSH